MEGKKGFILYTNRNFLIQALTNEQAGVLIKHIFDYVNDKFTKEEEDLIDDPVVKMAWLSFKADLKEDLSKWKNICERNRINGLKGGRPKQETQKKPKNPMGNLETQKTQRNPEKPKKADIDIDRDIDIDIEIDNNNVLSNDNTCTELKKSAQCLYQMPLIDGTFFSITKDDLKFWQELYQAVNVDLEIRKMLGWLEGSPKNRKTKVGIKRFINTWLSKAQDRAPKGSNYTNSMRDNPIDSENGGFEKA